MAHPKVKKNVYAHQTGKDFLKRLDNKDKNGVSGSPYTLGECVKWHGYPGMQCSMH